MTTRIKTLLCSIVYADGKIIEKLFTNQQLKSFKKTKTFKKEVISIKIEKTLTFKITNNISLTIKN